MPTRPGWEGKRETLAGQRTPVFLKKAAEVQLLGCYHAGLGMLDCQMCQLLH